MDRLTLAHTTSRPTAAPPADPPPVNGWTDYTLLIPDQDLLPHPLLLLPLLTDQQITLAHNTTSRPTATPPAATLPVNGRTDYTCTFGCDN